MARHAPSLFRVAPLALLVAAGSCRHAAPRPTLAQREAQCAPVWRAVHAEVDAIGAACMADRECREVRPEYLGCDAWANEGFQLGEGRVVELEEACATVSFIPDCGERVGACVAGRCTGRARVADAADGATVMARGLSGPGPGDLAGSYQLRPLDEVSHPPLAPLTRPRFADMGCVGGELRMPRELVGAAGKVTASFTVSTRGVPHAFRFDGTRRRELMYALAEAISRCALIPGKLGEVPIESRMVVPIRFAVQR